MNRVPRASISITTLDDEDYRVLMTLKGGLEAFGLFVAVLLAGRDRLQQDRARQLPGTVSLRFDESTTHVVALTRCTVAKMNRCLEIFAEVARETGHEPWIGRDESGHLVVRSFFKYNTSAGWGGHREGAGRKPAPNQDDSERNQVDSASESSRFPSGSGPEITDSSGTHAHAREPETKPRTGADLSHFEAALRLLDADPRAKAVVRELSEQAATIHVRSVDGWRLRVAAWHFTRPSVKDKQRNLAYLVGIAKNATRDELDELLSKKPARNGEHGRDSPPKPDDYVRATPEEIEESMQQAARMRERYAQPRRS